MAMDEMQELDSTSVMNYHLSTDFGLPSSLYYVANLSMGSPAYSDLGSFGICHANTGVFQVYEKFQVDKPQDLVSVLTHELVVATPGPYDARYLSPVTIGNQTLNLTFDTGSADLWVFSTELPTNQGQGHVLYNAQQSTTSSLLTGYNWSITYADSSFANGNVVHDSVTIDNVTVMMQAVELAQQVSSSFTSDTQFSGILGLSFSSLNTVRPVQQTTFFDTAIEEGVLPQQLFTADLQKGALGSYDFGYIDRSKYTADLVYTDVDSSRGFWNVTTTGYQVGSSDLQAVSLSGIVDTGTSLLVLDQAVVADYWGSVNGASYDSTQAGFVFPCEADLPTFSLGFENVLFSVPGDYLNYAPINDTACYGGLQRNDGIGFSIFGDVFIKSQFVVFDKGNMRVGFASKSIQATKQPSLSNTSSLNVSQSAAVKTAAPTTTMNLNLTQPATISTSTSTVQAGPQGVASVLSSVDSLTQTITIPPSVNSVVSSAVSFASSLASAYGFASIVGLDASQTDSTAHQFADTKSPADDNNCWPRTIAAYEWE
ncbi:hypothetical protein RBB50_009103 [Rhinocladiella similis]